jgi:hypothetical protein
MDFIFFTSSYYSYPTATLPTSSTQEWRGYGAFYFKGKMKGEGGERQRTKVALWEKGESNQAT